jgi:putative flippase GtrA
MTIWRRWLRFTLVGALGVVVQIVTVVGVRQTGSWRARPGAPGPGLVLAATIAGVAAAVVHNFVWHRRWTWADRARPSPGLAGQFTRFALANGAVSLGGNLGVVLVLVRLFHTPLVPATLAAIAMCSIVNFWLADRHIFHREAAPRTPHLARRTSHVAPTSHI